MQHIKRDPLAIIGRSAVESICRKLQYTYRQRDLDPATTLALFLQQIVAGNVPCSEVRHLGGGRFSASAYCQARSRLPLQL